MALGGPLTIVDTNVMAEGNSRDSLRKVAPSQESLLNSKDSPTSEGTIAGSNLLPSQTVQFKREDSKAFDLEQVKHDYYEEKENADLELEERLAPSTEVMVEPTLKAGIVDNLLKQNRIAPDTHCNSLYPKSSLKVLRALRLDPGCGEPLVDANLLPGSARGIIADSVAAFLIFIRTRYSMFEARQWGEDGIRVAPVFRDLHFTNIHREADTGTQYLRRRLIGRTREEQVLGIIVYRTVNRIQTFEEYKRNTGANSSLTSSVDLKSFMKFIKRKREKVFTNAHQALSIEKVEDTYDYCLENLEELTNKLLESNDLEEAFHLIKGIDNLGDFYAYQIVCDMVEIGLLKFSDDSWTCLGPGAIKGLQEVRADGMFNVGDQELVRRLARIADYGLPHLGKQPVKFLNRRLSVKAVEHSLCEFFKFSRAVKNGTEKGRRYKPRERMEEKCDTCGSLRGGRDWKECILCLRSYHTDCAEDWQSTMMDFFLCKPCHAIEAAKGCQVLEEEEEPVRCKQSFVRLKKVGFENAGYKL